MSFEDWKEVRLGDVVTLKRGYDLPKKNRKKGKYPVLASNGIADYHSEFKAESASAKPQDKPVTKEEMQTFFVNPDQ
ncbi:restriction endonuclease subunit S [Paenactinomyces guangxiensis]|uniref:Restriction endonuclease subunit S n=1 Tax=Paenactinomyces guangxiensis TaxID=1490290 RepID=A0A7W2A9Y1_9BACL|nr:restriction endonuclease subunit S [Paenactinomyces guangxiensis]MBA4495662.1 restriction endonuclease subunit S [Paenactinomyces guangxiensis]MBH8592650.1 restriction endonuclease subunit S [Paenactinomyces guangxiensis]